jgi:hypothetical protein
MPEPAGQLRAELKLSTPVDGRTRWPHRTLLASIVTESPVGSIFNNEW